MMKTISFVAKTLIYIDDFQAVNKTHLPVPLKADGIWTEDAQKGENRKKTSRP